MQCRGRDTYRHILGLELFDGLDLAINVCFLEAPRELRLLRLTELYGLVPDHIVSTIVTNYLC